MQELASMTDTKNVKDVWSGKVIKLKDEIKKFTQDIKKLRDEINKLDVEKESYKQ